MASKKRRGKSKRWMPDDVTTLATEPDISGADKLAQSLGGVVAALWNAKPYDAETDTQNAGTSLGQASQPLPRK